MHRGLTGALVVVALLLALLWGEYGDQLRATAQRSGLNSLHSDPFFPPRDARAEAILVAARLHLNTLARGSREVDNSASEGQNPVAQNVHSLESAGLEHVEDNSAPEVVKEPDLGEQKWFLSLYTPGVGPVQWAPSLAVIDGDVSAAVSKLWSALPVGHRIPEVAATTRLKLDMMRGEERSFPFDGGFKGVALDKGLDGIVLRHPERGVSYFLPSWGVEQEARNSRTNKYNSLARRHLHGRARRLTKERLGWKKSETRAASFAAFRTWSWVEERGGGGQAVPLARGNADVPVPNAEVLRERIALAADYLTRETASDGRLTYDYKASWDKDAGGYNILRHAGTGYSMFQAYRLTGDQELLDAASRAAGFFVRKMRADPDHPDEYFVVWKRRRAKLGGIGLGLCMLVEQEKAAPGSVDLGRLEGMARHIERMQNPDGSFESFFNYDSRPPSIRKSIYYSGEAILGLVRLHQLSGDPHWLEVAVKGADYLVNKRWVSLGLRIYVPPDAWLLQALEEMDRVAPDDRRADYALAIGEVIASIKLMDPEATPPDMLGAGLSGLQRLPHAATAGSFGEALTAAARLEARRRPGEERFLTYAMHNARFQLRNQFLTVNSYYLPNPARAMGGFRMSPDFAEIRNDHVQHNLSGMFGLLDILDPNAPDIGLLLPESDRVVLPKSGRSER